MQNDLVLRHAAPVPRYTSYPTAPHFHTGIDNAAYRLWLQQLPPRSRLSLYLHIPFCDQLCWFCGCHTKHTRRYDPVANYLVRLKAEAALLAQALPNGITIGSMHWGGGSPTILTPDDTVGLAEHLKSILPFADDAGFSVELDPRDLDEAKLDAFAAAGMTRASIGVQDFSPEVQQAINRLQSLEVTRWTVEGLRRRGVASINLDLVYGLPHQTQERLLATVAQALALQPDRLAVFGYAHVPQMKKHMEMIDTAWLAGPLERFDMARAAAGRIVEAGYTTIGFDHFAKPEDTLAKARRENRLRRNFQGYTDDAADAIVGLGASAIGSLPDGHIQNVVATADYMRIVDAGELPIARGIELKADDRLRGYVIERLTCDFAVSVDDLRSRFGAAADPILFEFALAAENDRDDLATFDGTRFAVTARGQPFVRSIAAGFDAYLAGGTARHSMAV
ncbi:oxygen-independent coproporphyrinogen III oxidase [Mangrovicella endophytica]|uniref:oxygen-independent coproporphyrinogen III oxidase n=1 Tax=Mangrovicella endophytica TaxID=2066697 RepID=UPI000C9E1BA9|nr:oxygen-independent coproporphyrinogen III oxidase [Mangrovicella endophytica]